MVPLMQLPTRSNGGCHESWEKLIQSGLSMHHVALIAFGGAVGASIFISVGNPLTAAGPMALLIGMAIWATAIWVCIASE